MPTKTITLPLLLVLAACSSPEPTDEAPAPTAQDGAALAPLPLDSAPLVEGPSEAQLAVLESRDCRAVAQAYADAMAARDFAFAARFWDDPVIDAARIEAVLRAYRQPVFTLSQVSEEGAAGSSYCTVTGALGDGGDQATPLRPGQIVWRRANDVPGATPEQLRWRIQSSTLVEKMERSGAGAPA